MDLVKYYADKKLLAGAKGNAKIAKNIKETRYLALIPHALNSSGVNICKFSTKECRAMCLNLSGQGVFNSVQQARKNKTDFFIQHKQVFMDKLYKELEFLNRKGGVAIRLNTISDVDWEQEFNNIEKSLADFPNITFYDYTKDPFKVDLNTLPNYHFTFSYSGGNWKWCEKFLKEKKANVAVVFRKSLPLEWQGFNVIDGTVSDERFNDGVGVIVGLKFKQPKNKVAFVSNKFVVEL